MTDSIPATVTNALEAVPVEGATALEAGAGVGNGTAGLLAADAEMVYSVTNEADHAETVRDRCPAATILQADLGAIPLPADTVDVVLAHGLFNVLPNKTAAAVAAELTRVVAPGDWLVVDDYDPHPPESRIRRLFAVENALAELAGARPAYVFYPADELRTLFEGTGGPTSGRRRCSTRCRGRRSIWMGTSTRHGGPRRRSRTRSATPF